MVLQEDLWSLTMPAIERVCCCFQKTDINHLPFKCMFRKKLKKKWMWYNCTSNDVLHLSFTVNNWYATFT